MIQAAQVEDKAELIMQYICIMRKFQKSIDILQINQDGGDGNQLIIAQFQ